MRYRCAISSFADCYQLNWYGQFGMISTSHLVLILDAILWHELWFWFISVLLRYTVCRLHIVLFSQLLKNFSSNSAWYTNHPTNYGRNVSMLLTKWRTLKYLDNCRVLCYSRLLQRCSFWRLTDVKILYVAATEDDVFKDLVSWWYRVISWPVFSSKWPYCNNTLYFTFTTTAIDI